MKKVIAGILLLAASRAAFGGAIPDTLFMRLQASIEAAPSYDGHKETVIRNLKDQLASSKDIAGRLDLLRALYEEYRTFNYDSAFMYAKALQDMSRHTGDRGRITASKIRLSFILVSAGLFKDAFDSLRTIQVQGLPDSVRAAFYSLMGRAFYDLADFDNDRYYTPGYNRQADAYLDSALACFAPGSFDYTYYKGLRDLKTGNLEGARNVFEGLMKRKNLSYHQMALVESTLSGYYQAAGRTDMQISLLMRAAIDDIRSSTKETTATLYLSGLFFKEGDVKSAFICVRKAIQDAVFYGARQRQVQVSSILPIIEGAKVNAVESQRKTLFLYSAVVTLLLVSLFVLIVVIYRQNNKLKAAKQIITEANSRQKEINAQLMEANRIKEEYMIHSYSINTDFFARMEKFRNSIERKLMDHKYDEIRFLLNNVNLKAEKEEMLKSFDEVFLRLFPDFVETFNSLFKEEDRVALRNGELLNTDMRIFALMRMGITDNEKIATILEYSVNTIYAYKARIKKKATVPARDFEEAIMQSRTT
jgi:hypothetical protein